LRLPNTIRTWLGIGCSFKFIFKVGVEESIVNAPRISCLNLTSLFTLFVFLVCRLTRGAFTINSSILTENFNEHPILPFALRNHLLGSKKLQNLKPREINLYLILEEKKTSSACYKLMQS
jgi:hypothetical protein